MGGNLEGVENRRRGWGGAKIIPMVRGSGSWQSKRVLQQRFRAHRKAQLVRIAQNLIFIGHPANESCAFVILWFTWQPCWAYSALLFWFSSWYSSTLLHRSRMLRIRMLSGAVVSMPVEEVSCVREAKRRLQQLHGMPPRFRQRLCLHGTNLDDATELDSPLELDLMLQPFSDTSETEVNELVAAARDGLVEKAGV